MSAFLTTRGMGGQVVASAGMGAGTGVTPPSEQDKFQIGGPEIMDLFPLVSISTPTEWVLRRKTIP